MRNNLLYFLFHFIEYFPYFSFGFWHLFHMFFLVLGFDLCLNFNWIMFLTERQQKNCFFWLICLTLKTQFCFQSLVWIWFWNLLQIFSFDCFVFTFNWFLAQLLVSINYFNWKYFLVLPDWNFLNQQGGNSVCWKIDQGIQ